MILSQGNPPYIFNALQFPHCIGNHYDNEVIFCQLPEVLAVSMFALLHAFAHGKSCKKIRRVREQGPASSKRKKNINYNLRGSKQLQKVKQYKIIRKVRNLKFSVSNVRKKLLSRTFRNKNKKFNSTTHTESHSKQWQEEKTTNNNTTQFFIV